jgi:hypothetical protein
MVNGSCPTQASTYFRDLYTISHPISSSIVSQWRYQTTAGYVCTDAKRTWPSSGGCHLSTRHSTAIKYFYFIFMGYLTTFFSIDMSDVQDGGWLINWKGLGRKQYWPNQGTIPEWLEGLRKPTKALIEDSRCLGRDSSREDPNTSLQHYCCVSLLCTIILYLTLSRSRGRAV